MNAMLQTQVRTGPNISFIPVQPGRLQRKCISDECEESRKERLTLQRRPTNQAEPGDVPIIVRKVLSSQGQPLDRGTREFMEPRFGHDFSRVRIHTDEKAAESVRSVNALAYTVRQDVVFGTDQYAPGTSVGKRLLAHELAHTVQQSNQRNLQNKLEVSKYDDVFEKEADKIASRVLDGKPPTQNISPVQQMTIQRAAIHHGNILDEGNCAHLACKSKYACKDNKNGITCPAGTRNASKTQKYRPLFTCDSKCENNNTCSDSDNWMAIPNKRFARSKCNQNLVICTNGKSTHAYVRDKSDKEAWEVSRGIQDKLGVSPYAKFTGSIYGDESDPEFAKDTRCRTAEKPKKTDAGSPPTSDSGENL